ncbi:MAG: IS21 family transposase [Sporichthyaceae bacterium]|nr:IS21 family transposase [Sporichthyaceae bacterium]
MSRNTVTRLLSLSGPPRYERRCAGSKVDAVAGAIAAMLDEDATVPATVVLARLRLLGFDGGVSILKEHLSRVRPAFAAARGYQRTTYLPGELAQTDWWIPPVVVPVGRGQTRPVSGLVTGLPFSAAFRVVFSFARTTAALRPALVGGLSRLGGLPAGLVFDNDPSVVASRRGGVVRLVEEVAALLGQLAIKPIPLRPAFPQGKGFIERAIGYLETSFLPLRSFTDIADLQAQADQWTAQVADTRRPRRLAGSVADALQVERGVLRPLPAVWPDVTERLEARASSDGFVRVGGVDYSVPPRLAGRRLSVRATVEEVVVFCERDEVARHRRSWVRADVVLAPAHARQLRLARQAQRALASGDVAVELPNLAAYDELVGQR